MPESRSRKKTDYTPPSGSKKVSRVGSSRWVAPTMLTFWVVGLIWIVVYYLLPDTKFVSDLGNWNLAIGMAFIAVGFVLSTRWE